MAIAAVVGTRGKKGGTEVDMGCWAWLYSRDFGVKLVILICTDKTTLAGKTPDWGICRA